MISSRRSLLSAAAAGFAYRLIAAPQPKSSRAFAFAGSFSFQRGPEGNSGNGKGVYVFEADLKTGLLTQREVAADLANPWWLTIHPSKKFLYAANEITAPSDTSSGSISSYLIDAYTGHLTLLNIISSGGGRPAQMSVHPSGKFVLVANFGGSNIAVFPVQSDGSLGQSTDVVKATGTPGPTKATTGPQGAFVNSGHDRAHPHMILADPAGQFLLESDLGTDQILTWHFDLSTGKLTKADVPAATLPPGDGPRHFAFHPSSKWVYSLQEEGDTLVGFDYNSVTGALTLKQTIPTVPKGFVGSDYTSEVIVSPDGRFVYVANRLYDSIAYFKIGPSGMLAAAGDEWARGDFPRHLAIDPTHTFLYCCNQKSDAITTFRINRETGGLTFTGQFTPIGTPAILVFLA